MSLDLIAFTPELIESHGLTPSEYDRFVSIIGRAPTLVELGIISAMWNEHCSYKSSKRHLKTLPTQGRVVIQGPGENAGVIDLGDGYVCVFKMESHNHPSFIEPFQGAATGVGGILRDIFTMGARPVAVLNALFFGEPEAKSMPILVEGVAKGISFYGNAFGVPNVGGSVCFDKSYNGNILVNAMAVGLAKKSDLLYSSATGVDNLVLYVGAKTGRDGIHGASMASASFHEDSGEKKPTVQIGDPFTEKVLFESCLEFMQTGNVIAIQDMGAAGLTCSAVEMGSKGNCGIELNLEHVPIRESDITPYEMMLSETQERMLLVIHPSALPCAEAIFKRWEMSYAVIGKVIKEPRFKVRYKEQIVADLPIHELGEQAPEYDRPYRLPAPPPPPNRLNEDLLTLEDRLISMLSSPALCSKRAIYSQYDHFILSNTLTTQNSDAAILRIADTERGFALTTDVTPRYCAADPFQGGVQAVAEAWRNLSASGAKPLAITDNLNFGNPENPQIMGQFVACIKGIAEACRELDFPVVSGNVSLYNESSGCSIKPTPTIGAVGLVDNLSYHATIGFKRADDLIIVLGSTTGHLSQSLYQEQLNGETSGPPPKVDLASEKLYGDCVRTLIQKGLCDTCHDLSDGGIAIGLAEMMLAGQYGGQITAIDSQLTLSQWLYCENQNRYLIAIKQEGLNAFKHHVQSYSTDVVWHQIGVTGGDSFKLYTHDKQEAMCTNVEALKLAHHKWLPHFLSVKQ